MCKFLSSLTTVVIAFSVFASHATASKIYIPIGKARVKKSVVAFPETKLLATNFKNKKFLRNVQTAILADLNFTNLFTIQKGDAFIENKKAGITLDSFRITDWSTIGTEFLVKTGVSMQGKNVNYELRLYDVLGTKQILGKRYIAKLNESKTLGHTVANDIVRALTGKPGIFFTKIAMVCDKSKKKEIWITNFDGSNPKQLTYHKTLSFSPDWAANNNKLAYSLYTKNRKNIKNIDLYEYNFKTRRSRLISNRKGINSGAAYSPNGRLLALTMSFLGNPEIFTLNLRKKEVTRITKSWGMDVDPAWSPDGTKIAFASSRAKKPMIYVKRIGTKARPKRITYAGRYNATPSWSPDGRKLVFSSFVDGRFDLFMVGADGTNLERLTRNEGSNEDPSFSPDGNFIVFSSNRSGQKNIYVITSDGAHTRRLTYGLGNCQSPRWSKNQNIPFKYF